MNYTIFIRVPVYVTYAETFESLKTLVDEHAKILSEILEEADKHSYEDIFSKQLENPVPAVEQILEQLRKESNICG
jgi:hypothetical protein